MVLLLCLLLLVQKQQLLLNYCMNASFYLLLKVAIMLASLG